MPATELQLDGLVGPTHHYAGLSHGNVASERHRGSASSPRGAVLEGIAKMRLVASLGVEQGVLPPHPVPDFSLLRRLGFAGSDVAVVQHAAAHAPRLLEAAYSASAMWAANAATVSPSADTADGRVHFTPANLHATLHRSVEAQHRVRLLRAVFADPRHFVVHDPLPAAAHLGDEGAANHLRLASSHGETGVEIFCYGRHAYDSHAPSPKRFPARQTAEASQAVARLHHVHDAVFVQQSPDAIDAGAFHTDVVAVANERVLFTHGRAFLDDGLEVIAESCAEAVKGLQVVAIDGNDVSLDDAVASYLFNSQLLSLPDGSMTLLAPAECQENARVAAALSRVAGAGMPISAVRFVDVRQSMRNGGGPACLRLRVVLTPAQLAAVHPGIRFTPALDAALVAWAERHYRPTLVGSDLADPKLIVESRDAMQALAGILGLPAAVLGCA